MMSKNKNQKQLAQFFTPLPVVDFMYKMVLELVGGNFKNPPRIIDPACGEGIFLKYALDNKISSPNLLFGIDKDESIKDSWQKLGLDKILGNHLYIQDGLCDTEDRQVSLDRKIKLFDLVIGNPPFGRLGIKDLDENDQLKWMLRKKYHLWKRVPIPKKVTGLSLIGEEQIDKTAKLTEWTELIKPLTQPEIQKIQRCPIEILFLERFIQLAKPAAQIAIILPEGILANVTLKYVRNWILEHCELQAIISLPRETFKQVGTTAKTCILFLRKFDQYKRPYKNKYVFMAAIPDGLTDEQFKNELKEILEAFKTPRQGGETVVSNGGAPEKLVTPVKSKIAKSMIVIADRDYVMKIDRWNPDFWDPKYLETIDEMAKRFQIKPLGAFVIHEGQGDTPRKHRGEAYADPKTGIPFLCADNLTKVGAGLFDMLTLGANWFDISYISTKQHDRLSRTKLKVRDLLVARLGDSIGKVAMILSCPPQANVNNSLDVFRLKGINTGYVTVFMQTSFTKLQIARFRSGVAANAIPIPDIKAIQIPTLPRALQNKIELEYKQITTYHDLAIEAKTKAIKQLRAKGYADKQARKEAENNPEYKQNLKEAEKRLKDLVKRTEEIIEGKRSDL